MFSGLWRTPTYDTVKLLDAPSSVFYSCHLDETEPAGTVGLLETVSKVLKQDFAEGPTL